MARNAQGITDPPPVTLTIDDDTPSANLDVDGNGEVRLFSDILLIIRYIFNIQGEPLTHGILANDAERTSPQDIVSYIESLYPASP